VAFGAAVAIEDLALNRGAKARGAGLRAFCVGDPVQASDRSWRPTYSGKSVASADRLLPHVLIRLGGRVTAAEVAPDGLCGLSQSVGHLGDAYRCAHRGESTMRPHRS
jgi:hypothetical protein